jgi:omega-hydroxy-beta-dihydromenaquinone-9 sulfotransferase
MGSERNNADGLKPSLDHPLCGSDPLTLVTVLVRNGFVPPSRLLQVGIALGSVLLRAPFSLAEAAWFAWERRRQPPMPAPLFIIGHWRSGTTHLYNVLSRDPQFGFVPPLAVGLPWDMFGLGAALRPVLERALPKHRYIDNISVKPDSPQEDEIALANMTPLSFYHGLYFPSRFDANFRRGLFFEGCTRAEIERWRRHFIYFLEKGSSQSLFRIVR